MSESECENPIDSEAAQWVVRMDAGDLPADAQAALARWLDADPRHRGAFLRAQAAWACLDKARVLPGRRDDPDSRSLNRRRVLAVGGAGTAVAAFAGAFALWPRRSTIE